MAWAKLDDQITFHPKVIAAGNEAIGVWSRMIAYAAAHLTDGFVSDDIAMMMAGRRKPLDRLLEVGLLDPASGGYQVHDYLDWNDSAEVVRARRLAEAERKATARSKQGRGPDGRIMSGRLSGRTTTRTAAGQPPDGHRSDSDSDSDYSEINTQRARAIPGTTQPVLDALVQHAKVLAPPSMLVDAFAAIGTAVAAATEGDRVALAADAVGAYAKYRESCSMPPGWNANAVEKHAAEIQRIMQGIAPTSPTPRVQDKPSRPQPDFFVPVKRPDDPPPPEFYAMRDHLRGPK